MTATMKNQRSRRVEPESQCLIFHIILATKNKGKKHWTEPGELVSCLFTCNSFWSGVM